MAKPLESELALVTGSSRGIGVAIAIRLAAEGASGAEGVHRQERRAEKTARSSGAGRQDRPARATVEVLNAIYETDFLGFCVLQKYTDEEVMMT